MFFTGHLLHPPKPTCCRTPWTPPYDQVELRSERGKAGWSSECDHETCSHLKMVALSSTQWNLTHYTYTCSSGGLESDTTPIPAGSQRLRTEQWKFRLKHLYAHVSAPTGLEETEKTKKVFCSLAAGTHDDILADHLCQLLHFMFSVVNSILLCFL